jgi:hypothetical protein
MQRSVIFFNASRLPSSRFRARFLPYEKCNVDLRSIRSIRGSDTPITYQGIRFHWTNCRGEAGALRESARLTSHRLCSDSSRAREREREREKERERERERGKREREEEIFATEERVRRRGEWRALLQTLVVYTAARETRTI